MAYVKKEDGIFRDPETGRVWEHRGYSMRFHWSAAMVDYLRRNFATTRNEELAGCLGMSKRAINRKAAELGLRKDPRWLRRLWCENVRMARAAARASGNTGRFKKGRHASPSTEFKPGRRVSPEQRARQSEVMKKWHLFNKERHRRSMKAAWERRKNGAAPHPTADGGMHHPMTRP